MTEIKDNPTQTKVDGLRDQLDWTRIVPPLAFVVLVLFWGRSPGPLVAVLLSVILAASILAAVQHAEIVAHRVGEPFGSLVLAISVTVIEVGMILMLMNAGGEGTETLGRDTVFAAVMISCNAIIGLSIFIGAIHHDAVPFNSEGSGGALATVIALATLCFVLPNFTVASPGPQYAPGQLAFAAVASLVLYGTFVMNQTVRHRDFFLPVDREGDVVADDDHADPPTNRTALISVVLLMVSLVTVVGMSKVLSKSIESLVSAAGLPQAFVGVVIALLVLAPESLSAVRAARRDRLQTSFNLGYGSAVASIGLTVPVLAIAVQFTGAPLHLGLSPMHMVLLAVTAVLNILTVIPGRATRLQGAVHLVIFAAFLYLSTNP